MRHNNWSAALQTLSVTISKDKILDILANLDSEDLQDVICETLARDEKMAKIIEAWLRENE